MFRVPSTGWLRPLLNIFASSTGRRTQPLDPSLSNSRFVNRRSRSPYVVPATESALRATSIIGSGMDQLPNRDTIAAFEARLGPRLTSVLIWLLAGALSLGALGVILGSL